MIPFASFPMRAFMWTWNKKWSVSEKQSGEETKILGVYKEMEILQTKSSKQRREPIQKSMVKKINLMEALFGLANGAANQKLVYFFLTLVDLYLRQNIFLVAGHDFEFQRVISYNFFLYMGFRSRLLSFHRKVRKKRDVSLFFFTTSTCSQILRYWPAVMDLWCLILHV